MTRKVSIRACARAAMLAGAILLSTPAAAAEPNGTGTYQDLITLFAEFNTWRAQAIDPLASDFRQPAVAKRRAELAAMQTRLENMAVSQWDVPRKVDWLTVRSRMDETDFIYKITRPWQRDPGFYLASMRTPAFTSLPVKGAALTKLRSQLAQVPAIISRARETLNDVTADHADLAIASLTVSDGVEDGYPYRAQPPAGVIGWYQDLLSRAKTEQPALVPDIERTIASLRAFETWLVTNRPGMTGRGGVGETKLNWYLKNVLLMPYTVQDTLALSKREFDRLWGFYALERHRNRSLPELELSNSTEDYERKLDETDARIRKFITAQDFMTLSPLLPADRHKLIVPPNYHDPNNVPFIKRSTPPNYWEQIQYRDPSPDHWHAVVPGHRYDNLVSQNLANPIRASVKDGARWQGWAVYLEEGPLQMGFYDDKPRVRELIYLFGLWRAARSMGDIWNQLNEKTAEEVVDYWMSSTPYMDRNVARKYANIRAIPGHGLEYTMGNLQMWTLLADRKRQLGDRFELKAFHDAVMEKGRIPLSLVRWEITGLDDEVKPFFERTPLEP